MNLLTLMRAGALLAAVLVAACAADQAGPEELPDPSGAGALCRVGPDGGLPAGLTVDRGIGGTGAPLTIADRGIGGTGIIGVVTGFASVCVNGLEVQYDTAAPVAIDGAPASVAALRAGQVVAITADGAAASLRARSIAVRTEVAGRIESVQFGSGLLTIGGQPVAVSPGTWGADRFALGDWVAVSGLRRPDGAILALRLDSAPVGALRARGRVSRSGGTSRVGSLALPDGLAADLTPGQPVTVSGSYVAGRPVVDAVSPEALFADAVSYFGSAARRLVLETYTRTESGFIVIDDRRVPTGSGVAGKQARSGVAIVTLDRGPDGSFTAVGVRYTDPRRTRPAAGTGRGATIGSAHDRPSAPPNGAAPAALAPSPDAPNVDPATGTPADPTAPAAPNADLPSAGTPGSQDRAPFSGGTAPAASGAAGGIPLSSLTQPAAPEGPDNVPQLGAAPRLSVSAAVQSATTVTHSGAAATVTPATIGVVRPPPVIPPSVIPPSVTAIPSASAPVRPKPR